MIKCSSFVNCSILISKQVPLRSLWTLAKSHQKDVLGKLNINVGNNGLVSLSICDLAAHQLAFTDTNAANPFLCPINTNNYLSLPILTVFVISPIAKSIPKGCPYFFRIHWQI